MAVASSASWYPVLQLRKQRHAISALLQRDAASAAWQTGAASHRTVSDKLHVHIGATVEISGSYRYCWFPTVHMFSTGELLVTMRMSPDETNPEGEFSAFSVSHDHGRTWSRRYTLGAGANVDAAYSQAVGANIWVLGSGYDTAEPYPPGQRKQFHIVLSRFWRGGMALSQERDAVLELARSAGSEPARLYDLGRKEASRIGSDLPVVNPWGDILADRSGNWLATVYYKTGPDPRSTRLVLVRSTDRGMTWREVSVIAKDEFHGKPLGWMGGEGPSEAGMVRLADGRLYVVFRTGGYLGETWSQDDGATWNSPVNLHIKGVAPRIRRLACGALACTFGRPGPVSIMFSADGTGRNWSHITRIFDGMSTRYTGLAEIAPGKLFVVYDSVPYGWGRIPPIDKAAKNAILGTFVSVWK
ncbi:MAG TPA: sialidase family protein [Bryobacteraceae bacterium]